MNDQQKSPQQQKTEQRFEELPLHVRSMLHDEWRRLREVKQPAEDITRGSWI